MHYVLTPEADADLKSIWDYTEVSWGQAQVIKYLETLEAEFLSIAQGKSHTRPSPIGEVGLEFIRCEHHYIFVLKTAPLQIIRLLHERMDYMARLKHRLA